MNCLSRSGIGRSSVPVLVSPLPLDRVPDEPRRIRVVEPVDGDDSGWRRDVDLGQPASADDVDPDEQQAAPREVGAKRRANRELSVGQFGALCRAADGKVGAELAFAWPAVYGSGNFA